MVQRLVIVLGVVLMTGPAWAAGPPLCKDPQTQSEMNMCAARDFEAADRALNIAYAKARASAREADAEQPAELRGIEKALINGQRGWIAYRDGHCAHEASESRGGSMEPMLLYGCMAALTRARTKELKVLTDGVE